MYVYAYYVCVYTCHVDILVEIGTSNPNACLQLQPRIAAIATCCLSVYASKHTCTEQREGGHATCVRTAYMLVYIPLFACSCLHIPACTYQTQHLRRICMPRIYKHILHVYHHVFTYAHALTWSVSAASAPTDSSFATVPASPFLLA